MNIRLRLHHVTPENREHQFFHAVEELAKAMKVSGASLSVSFKEPMLPVLEGFCAELMEDIREMNNRLLAGLTLWVEQGMAKAEGVWKMPDTVIYNPKTGQPMSQSDWNIVAGAIDGFYGASTKNLSQRIAQTGAALAAMTRRLEKVKGLAPEKVSWAELSKKLPPGLKLESTAQTMGWKTTAPVQFRADNIATYVTSVTEGTRNEIKRILNDGLRDRTPVKKVTRELFDSLHDRNKDWERIARTETQNSYTDGAMVTELSDSAPDEKVYMIGAGSAGACPVCRRDIIGKVVLLLPGPPEGGAEQTNDPVTSVAIWPGKTSIGHKAREPWAAVTRHPHCGCRWVRYYPPMSQKQGEE